MLLSSPICDFGWKAPNFILKDVFGKSYEIQDYLGEQGLLIAFICNHCPYVQRIGHKLAIDAHILMSEGINVLAMMSNDYKYYPEDSPKNMEEFSDKFGFMFPYLVDELQTVGGAYGAVCTPDFFGFNAQGKLQYRGRLDDSGANTNAQRVPELVNAMRLIAKTGQGPKEQRPSMGCSIKWRD